MTGGEVSDLYDDGSGEEDVASKTMRHSNDGVDQHGGITAKKRRRGWDRAGDDAAIQDAHAKQSREGAKGPAQASGRAWKGDLSTQDKKEERSGTGRRGGRERGGKRKDRHGRLGRGSGRRGRWDDEGTRCVSFEAMQLREQLFRGILAMGFRKPSAVQQRAVVPIIQGRDVLAQAHAGTGKTAMVGIGVLQNIAVASKRHPQALVVAPTREVANQVADVMNGLGRYLGIRVVVCIGGEKVAVSARAVRAGCHVVVGTPGRVLDLVNRGELNVQHVKTLVLDEADVMLSEGFVDSVYDLYKAVPASAQFVIMSATFPDDVLRLSRQFLTKPFRVLVRDEDLALETLRQYHVNVKEDRWKLDAVLDLYSSVLVTQSIIFCQTKDRADWVCGKLQKQHLATAALHGGDSQSDRETVLASFRQGRVRVLVTTDVCARGIDVQSVSLVINFDLPSDREMYIHRVGRAGRFGRKGLAISLVTTEDEARLRQIKDRYAVRIPPLPRSVVNSLS